MADPISSLGPNNSLDCHVDDHAEATSSSTPVQSSAAPSAARAGSAAATASAALPAGAKALVARVSLGTSSSTVAGGSHRESFTGLKSQVELGAFKETVELATGYVQSGTDKDAQVALMRRTAALSGHGYGVTVTSDVGAARAYLGENNDDGSIGGNIGIGAEAAGVEVTVDTPLGSLTYGQSASVGAGGSMGVRDADHDGEPEFCAKFSLPAYTVGVCVERFW